MEAIRISCAGYPTRRGFYEFVDRFGILAPVVLRGSPDEVTAAKRLLEKVDLKGFQIGKTMVFLRAGQMAELDALRNEVLGRSAKVIQRRFRSHLARRNFILLINSAIQLQAVCRGQLARQLHENLRRQTTSLRIQKYSRMYLARKAYKELLSSYCTIQAGLRGMSARKDMLFRRQTRAAIVIQCHCRMYLARMQYLRLKKAAIATQCAWRGKIARRELRMLKMARRSTNVSPFTRCLLKNFRKRTVALGSVSSDVIYADSYSITIDDIFDCTTELYVGEGTLADVSIGDTITWPKTFVELI